MSRVNDVVSVTLTGVLTDYDPELGYWTLRGHAPGQEHIEWEWKFHWATEFQEPVNRYGEDMEG